MGTSLEVEMVVGNVLALQVAALLAAAAVWPDPMGHVIGATGVVWFFVVFTILWEEETQFERRWTSMVLAIVCFTIYGSLAGRPPAAPYASMGRQLAAVLAASLSVYLGWPSRRAS